MDETPTTAVSLPAPGEVYRVDYRKTDAAAKQAQRVKERGNVLSVVQWNIERGYQLPKIIEELKTIDADIIGIQEGIITIISTVEYKYIDVI